MRNREISFCNMILCLLVMWIHICSVAVSTWDKASGAFFAVEMAWRLSAFVVQGFLFLSALKLFRNMEKKPFSYGAFLWGRIRKIGVPYLIAVLVSYLGLIWLGYYAFDLKFLVKSTLLGNMIAPFYFIIILFQFYVLMPVWRWMVRKVDFWAAAVSAVLLMAVFHDGLPSMIAMVSPETEFPYNDRVFTSYLAYWVLGCYAGRKYDGFLESLHRNKALILCFFLISACVDGLLYYGMVRGILAVPFLEDIHRLYVVFAMAFLLLLGDTVGQKVMGNRVCQAVDAFSYELYLYHGIWLYVVQDRLLGLLGITNYGAALAARMFCCYGLAVIAALAVQYLRKRKADMG